MTATYQTNITDQGYNGWSNHATWDIALWLQNDEGLYNLCDEVGNYADLVEVLKEMNVTQTPDGVRYDDPEVNHIEIDSEVFDR